MALHRRGLRRAPLRLPWARAQPGVALLPSLDARGWHSGPGSETGGGGLGRHAIPRGLYELLGVPANSTQAQIKTAYYKQSFLYHPDRNAGSEEAAERFTHINEAYLVLGSVALRKKYDRGILSQEDLRTAGKPTGKDAPATAAAAAASPRRTQMFTTSTSPRHSTGKPIFDFDKFYQAHYGEQLERDRFVRQMRQEMLRRKKDTQKKWKLDMLQEFAATIAILCALTLIFSFK